MLFSKVSLLTLVYDVETLFLKNVFYPSVIYIVSSKQQKCHGPHFQMGCPPPSWETQCYIFLTKKKDICIHICLGKNNVYRHHDTKQKWEAQKNFLRCWIASRLYREFILVVSHLVCVQVFWTLLFGGCDISYFVFFYIYMSCVGTL